jgi:hypothetical protein
MRHVLSVLTLTVSILVTSVAPGQPREFPGGARLVKTTDRKNQPVCLVLTPMRGAQAVVQGPRLWFRTDLHLGTVIARNPPPTARPDQEEAADLDLVAVEARVISMSREAASSLIASLSAGRPLVLTWTDVKKERHTARIDPGGFAAAHDAAVKECGWAVTGR